MDGALQRDHQHRRENGSHGPPLLPQRGIHESASRSWCSHGARHSWRLTPEVWQALRLLAWHQHGVKLCLAPCLGNNVTYLSLQWRTVRQAGGMCQPPGRELSTKFLRPVMVFILTRVVIDRESFGILRACSRQWEAWLHPVQGATLTFVG